MSTDPRPLILIVDDDPGIALLQRRRLERSGYRAEVADDLDTAMAILAAGGVALVVLDYRLGETTGLDLHRRMKAAGVGVPVILVSGSLEDSAVAEAMRAGIRDIVVKTTDYLEHLPDAVRAVLQQAGAEVAPPAAHGDCILIVEDEAAVAKLERKRLERAGYSVKTAATADEAMAAIRKGGIALAVLDLRLAGPVSGLELYETLKLEGHQVPAILVTGFADQTVAIRALRAGIRDFVPKSTDYLEYLPVAVDRVISQVSVERKLAESELRLASVIGTTMDAILMCDEHSSIVLFNHSAEQLFVCPAADALNQPITRFIPDLRLGGDGADGGVRERRELDGLRAGGTPVPIEVSVTDVVIGGRRLFTVIARDITERRRAEGELREADRRKDEFLGMLAHELRNPLAAIMNAGEVMHRTLGDSPAQKMVSVIRRQTRALSRMVDDLLDVSRVTLGKITLTKEPVLLGDVALRATEAAREAAVRGGITLELFVAPEPFWLQADSTRIEQVITNLLNNAVKFTPPGGRVTVTIAAEDAQAVIRVRDTGVGMPATLVPRVFDLFVQGETSLDRARSGLGIGLALVRQIVTLHGGSVVASSEGPGRGSEFVVRLPFATEVQVGGDAPAARASTERPMRVLVVDDQPDVADSVAMLIETFGHSARAVYDGAEALAIIQKDMPDVLFADIGMPGMTGYELAERVRANPLLSGVRLVALTGYGRKEDRSRVIEAGFDLHIMKPVTDIELHSALAKVAVPQH
jgi:PAS domain S-box-containing protein